MVLTDPLPKIRSIIMAFWLVGAILLGLLAAKFGLLALGAVVIASLWLFIFNRWQRGIYLLLVYLPFAGAIVLAMYPSSLPLLFKDFFFVVPVYLAYFLIRRPDRAAVSPSVIGLLLAFSVLVLVQMLNPQVLNWLVAAIGLKVWLFYVPLIILGSVMIKRKPDLIKVFRIMTVVAWVPCVVGILEWNLSMAFGYKATMEALYGPAAAGATQNFAGLGMGTFFRIPSTFSFWSQYFGFTLAMVVPAYALSNLDTSTNWRRFANITLALVVLASFLSGARSAFVFVPILLVLIYLLDGKFAGMIKLLVFGPVIGAIVLMLARIDLFTLVNTLGYLLGHYATTIVYNGFVLSIDQAPLGLGTGMNTGPARYAFADPSSFGPFENYYAKVIFELGIPGLLLLVAIFLSLIVLGLQRRKFLEDKGLRSCSAAFIAFTITMALNSLKHWQLDLDPINVYFWLFAGFMFKLNYLDSNFEPQ